VTKDEYVVALRAFADEIESDQTMRYVHLDLLVEELITMQRVLAVAKKRKSEIFPRGRGKRTGLDFRDRSTPENREFWDGIEDAADRVATWPDWKRQW
jgi:hypothetical protein